MLIAILMTNTDESDFAQKHPKDGEKFSALLREVQPDWAVEVFSVKDGEFPTTIEKFDGFLITGSPASVHDGDEWITRLEQLIREIQSRKRPLYGACFGHQVIATALGGTVGYNPDGWVLGTVETKFLNKDQTQNLHLYAAHKEQVLTAPQGAKTIAQTPGCPIAGFAIGKHIQTTQYHPEMTPNFIAALVDELSKDFDPTIIQKAKSSMKNSADRAMIAQQIAEFFGATAEG